MSFMKDYRISHTSERIVRQYEEVVYRAGSYDDMLWQREKEILKQEVEKLRKQVRDIEYLDFGCGTGRILVFLEEYMRRSVGVDPAEAMIAVARECSKQAELVVADITRDDTLSGQQFDLITAFRVFLNSQPDLREEMLSVLVPKLRDDRSRFIFNIHGNLISFRFFTKLWYMLRGRRLNTMTVSAVKHMAERHGLEIVRWYGFGVKPKIFYRLLGARFMFAVDSLLSKIPWMKYISYDLVFVCKRRKMKNET